jgi:hypothetical protein
MASAKREPGWFRRHQRTIREWLVLLAAVVVAIVGWQQIADERTVRKEAEEKDRRAERRAQANEVAVWSGSGGRVILSNRSHQPVYQAVVSRVAVEGAGPRVGRELSHRFTPDEQQPILVIPPGETIVRFRVPYGGMGLVPGFEVAFKDQVGNSWVRYANGDLNEIDRGPAGYYRLPRPIVWR